MTPADLVGKTVGETLPPELVAEAEALYRRALAGDAFAREHSADGVAFVSRGTPLYAATGEIVAVLALSYDITDRKGGRRSGPRLRRRTSGTVGGGSPVADARPLLVDRVARAAHALALLLGYASMARSNP